MTAVITFAEVSLVESMYVYGKQPAYPSPNLTLTLTSHFGQNVRFGKGRWAFSQKQVLRL